MRLLIFGLLITTTLFAPNRQKTECVRASWILSQNWQYKNKGEWLAAEKLRANKYYIDSEFGVVRVVSYDKESRKITFYPAGSPARRTIEAPPEQRWVALGSQLMHEVITKRLENRFSRPGNIPFYLGWMHLMDTDYPSLSRNTGKTDVLEKKNQFHIMQRVFSVRYPDQNFYDFFMSTLPKLRSKDPGERKFEQPSTDHLPIASQLLVDFYISTGLDPMRAAALNLFRIAYKRKYPEDINETWIPGVRSGPGMAHTQTFSTSSVVGGKVHSVPHDLNLLVRYSLWNDGIFATATRLGMDQEIPEVVRHKAFAKFKTDESKEGANKISKLILDEAPDPSVQQKTLNELNPSIDGYRKKLQLFLEKNKFTSEEVALVPVPSSKPINKVFAQHLSQQLEVDYMELVSRSKGEKQQFQKHLWQRLGNAVATKYRFKKGKNKKVIIFVDDVFTSGATITQLKKMAIFEKGYQAALSLSLSST